MLGNEIENMKKEIENIENESKSLAYELVQDCKRRGKRDFITIIVLISLLFLSNIAWIWYINQYDFTTTYEEISQQQDNTTNSHMTGEIN